VTAVLREYGHSTEFIYMFNCRSNNIKGYVLIATDNRTLMPWRPES
jgi:hypothetical protein